MKSLFGGILLAVGILIAGASGLCTLVIVGLGFTEPDGLLTIGPMALIFGGIPFLIGLALFFGGRALLRQAKGEKAQNVAEVFGPGDQPDS